MYLGHRRFLLTNHQCRKKGKHFKGEPLIALGVSPRGSIALLKMARAMAVMRGGDYVVPEDVLSVIDDVWRHRIRLNARARAEGLDASKVILRITERIHAV